MLNSYLQWKKTSAGAMMMSWMIIMRSSTKLRREEVHEGGDALVTRE